MNKKILLLFIFCVLSVFIKAQVKAYEYSSNNFNETTIEGVLADARKNGTQEWEVQKLKKHLYERLEKQKRRLAQGIDERTINNPPAPMLACQPSCSNLGFESGNTTGWSLTSGDINGVTLPCNTCATGAGAITALTTATNSGAMWTNGIDNCSGQPALAPGGGVYSIAINNMTDGGKMQEIQQQFNVTAANNVLTYQYLAVLENPNHPTNEQPYFFSQVLDGSGAAIACTYYLQAADAGAAGWVNCPAAGCSDAQYKGWVTVTLDLTAYIGQCVTLQFIASDCNLGGHYGYAYVDASCDQVQVNNTITVCPPSAQLCGPAGFLTYSWTGPVTGSAMCLPGATAGDYTLVTTAACPAPTRFYTVTVSPTPTVAFTSTVTPCNMTVPFTDHSSVNGGATITSYSWTFGDGQSSAAQSPSNTYTTTGTFNVALTCTSSAGCVGTFSSTVTLGTGPSAAFSATTVCPGNPTVFTNTSTGATTYSWDFGDGTGPGASTATNPTYIYPAGSGTYTAVLTATGAGTCIATHSVVVVVSPLPTASFTANPVCLGVPTSFTTTTTPAAGLAYNWTFGDPPNGTSTINNPSYTYGTSNIFAVSLTVSVGSCSVVATNTVLVAPLPTASFTVGPVCEGTASVFDASASTPAVGATYSWSFGGAAPNTDVVAVQTDNHTYTSSGTFPVTLVVSVGTCSATVTGSAVVNPMPTVSFSTTPVCLGNPTSFTTTLSSVGTYTYTWDYNDGSASAIGVQNPSYTYTIANTYAPSLTLTAVGGCTATATAPAVVNPVPAATFTALTACLGSSTIFNSTITNGNFYTWNFGGAGNGSNIITPTPTYTYSSSGVFPVTLTVTATGGCSVTATANATVNPIPAMVAMADQYWCPSYSTTAVPLAMVPSPAGSVIIYSWSYNTAGGVPSTGSSPPSPPVFPSLYPTSNTGQTTLQTVVTVTPTLDGCVGPPSSFNIFVYPNPVAKFSATDLICEGQAMAFTDLSTPNTGAITVNQWAWDLNGDGSIDANAQSPSYTYPVGSAGTTSVTLYIGTSSVPSCTAQITEPIFINPNPVALFVGDSLKSCPKLNTKFTDLSSVTINGVATTSITTWAWTFGNGGTSNLQIPPQQTYTNASPTQSAFFNVSLTVTTDSGCVNKKTINNYVQVYPRPIADFSWGPAGVDIDDPTVVFVDQSIGASTYPAAAPYTYGPGGIQYYLGDVFAVNQNSNTVYGGPTETTFSHVYEYYDPYTYSVTQWVINKMGCKDSITKPVEILPNFTFYIPNAFSPNGDGTNEGFKGTGVGIDNTTYNLWVFDRWGMMIFYANDLEKSWDGHMRGSDGKPLLQQDVYVWKVKFQDQINHKNHEYHGTVTLLK